VATLVRETEKKEKNHFHTKFEFFSEEKKYSRVLQKEKKIPNRYTHRPYNITSYYFIQTYLGGIKKERYPRGKKSKIKNKVDEEEKK
jgi:hypothetical protein